METPPAAGFVSGFDAGFDAVGPTGFAGSLSAGSVFSAVAVCLALGLEGS